MPDPLPSEEPISSRYLYDPWLDMLELEDILGCIYMPLTGRVLGFCPLGCRPLGCRDTGLELEYVEYGADCWPRSMLCR
jgi:hypothetical protein